MSSIPAITGQIGSLGNCTPQDCCNQINALNSKIQQLDGRLRGLENKPIKDHSADIGKLFALLGTMQIGVTALGLEIGFLSTAVAGAVGGVAAIGAEIAIMGAAIAAAAAEAAAVAAALAPLILGVAAIAGISALASQALSQAQQNSTRVGPIGPTGRTGERGLTGAQGAAGLAGAPGRIGAQGYAGLAGAPGRTGSLGSAGLAGAPGRTGATGTAGLAGAPGRTGAQGSAGLAGVPGRTGSQGAAGIAGVPGRTGSQGAAGIAGVPGRTGAKGFPGLAGATGQAGIQGVIGLAGIQGLAGLQGLTGDTGAQGLPGIGAPGLPGLAGAPGATGARGEQGIQGLAGITTTIESTVNPGKEDEIIRLIQGTRSDVLAMPATLVGSQLYRAAAVSAAAAGSCQSSKPGGCPGGSADQISGLGGIMNGIGAAVGLLNNQLLQPMSQVLNTINTKLGSQIVGGLSAWSKGISEVVNKSQILNALTYISVLHNAYMLSNALSQTLFSAISNSLAALGLKDTSVDPTGQPLNVGKIVGDWTENFFKAIFGVATVNGIKADWKKYSRIYQATANIIYSVQSIGHSILGALEVVGSYVAKIGNGLRNFRIVSEKAYTWMNPTPAFQNRFFTGLQATQEIVSNIDQVASEVLSVEQSIGEMGKLKTELESSMRQANDSKQATVVPEAAKVKQAADEAKTASKSPAIPDTAIVKPD